MNLGMIRVREHGSFAAPGRLWRLAILTAAGVVGATTQADAVFDYYYGQYYYPNNPYYYRQNWPVQRQKPRPRSPVKKEVAAEKDTGAKPQGPLIIAISIEKQKLKIYDSNGLFAESPVSTGTKSHPTPMGVFSVIQKHKFHHSNIYSGAPMPYMQRITWSGVAMHAGVLPGYPASHGCIRLPMAFAIKLWNWTRMGARVVVTPGELAPENFSHPLLASFKVPPQPTAAADPDTNTQADSKNRAAAETSIESSDNAVTLKASLGHHEPATPASDRTAVAMAREQTRAADAGGDAPRKQPLTLSDASSDKPLARDESAARNESKPDKPISAKPAETADATKNDRSRVPEADKPAAKAEPADPAKDAKKDENRASAGDKPAATKPEPPKRAGQIAVLISRKDSKLYVRQNFSPLFETPVTIAPSDRPLGTHVFTAGVDKDNANALHWSVVSLPASIRHAPRQEHDARVPPRRRVAAKTPIEAKPAPVPDSPAAALDRLTIPADTMARINEMLTNGGSIIVSDQGINQGETGAGTDFIVRLR